jgi:hypothetical protein
MTDWPVLDLAIGLTLVYTAVSLLCSTVNEAIASLVGRRAKFMEKWLRGVLENPAATGEAAEEKLRAFYEHPLIKPLLRKSILPKPETLRTSMRKTLGRPPIPPTPHRAPSYIPAKTFVTALLNLSPPAPADPAGLVGVGKRTLAEIKAGLPPGAARDVVLTIIHDVGNNEYAIRKRLEDWYDESMDRVSGWYKRRVQLVLAVIGLIAACVLNVDSIQIAETLWSQPNARAAVTAKAADFVAAKAKPPTTKSFNAAVKDVGSLSALEIPIGWNFKSGDLRDFPHTWKARAAKVMGIFITVLALLLGAPFWFDLLGRLVSLKGAGPPPPANAAMAAGSG